MFPIFIILLIGEILAFDHVIVFGLTSNLTVVPYSSIFCSNITDCYIHICKILDYEFGPASFATMDIPPPYQICEWNMPYFPADMVVVGLSKGLNGKGLTITSGTSTTCPNLQSCIFDSCNIIQQSGVVLVAMTGKC